MAQQYGLLIDNYWCTGCHSCEIACKKELNLPLGQWGIKLLELGPWQKMDTGTFIAKDQWEHRYIPTPTSYCNLCEDRVAEGKKPACVHHCLASAMEFGPVEELAKKMAEKGRACSLWIP